MPREEGSPSFRFAQIIHIQHAEKYLRGQNNFQLFLFKNVDLQHITVLRYKLYYIVMFIMNRHHYSEGKGNDIHVCLIDNFYFLRVISLGSMHQRFLFERPN